MNQEELEYQQRMEQEKVFSQSQFEQSQMNQSIAEQMREEQNRGVIKEQLDLEKELKLMEHLLRGEIEIENDNGTKKWLKPENNDEVLLTEEGIQFILKSIRWYLNKNTLLSNYNEETIDRKMQDFSTTLADYLFMNYDKFFLYPTTEECQKILLKRLEKKKQQIIYNMEITRNKINEDEIWKKIVSEINPEKERINIREQIIKIKLKGYDWLMRMIQDSVHSAYNRALFGAERRTLRQHIHISEVMGDRPKPMKEKSGGMMNFFRRR